MFKVVTCQTKENLFESDDIIKACDTRNFLNTYKSNINYCEVIEND